jgi:hypothetical protein
MYIDIRKIRFKKFMIHNKITMKQIIYILFSVFLISACNGGKKSNVMYDLTGAANSESFSPITRSPEMSKIPPPVENVKSEDINKKKIIKDGSLQLKVNDQEKTKTEIDSLVNKYGGYYDNVNFNNTDYEISYNLKIRIPSDNFEKFVTAIESGKGEVVSKVIHARDVTEQFIDLETRLENKRNYLKRYNELLKQAKNVKDILEIEEKTRGIEEEIESAEGRLKYLSDQVSYSTLDLILTKEKPYQFIPKVHGKFMERLKQSLSGGWFGFISFVLFLIRIWPLWIILAIAIPGWKKLRKRKKDKK